MSRACSTLLQSKKTHTESTSRFVSFWSLNVSKTKIRFGNPFWTTCLPKLTLCIPYLSKISSGPKTTSLTKSSTTNNFYKSAKTVSQTFCKHTASNLKSGLGSNPNNLRTILNGHGWTCARVASAITTCHRSWLCVHLSTLSITGNPKSWGSLSRLLLSNKKCLTLILCETRIVSIWSIKKV